MVRGCAEIALFRGPGAHGHARSAAAALGDHACAAGSRTGCPGKTEMHPEVLRADIVFCELEPQTRTEGDIQQMPTDFAVTEFWQGLEGRHPGRRSAEEVTLFDAMGFALED